jgi:hypothetical protein
MPTGNVPLVTAAKYGDDMIVRGVIQTLIEGSPFLEQLPWITVKGNALRRTVEATLPNTDFRAVNAGYTPSHGSNDFEFWGTAILGTEYRIDNYLVRVVDNVTDLENDQIQKAAKSNRMRFDWEFINGDGSYDGFKGLEQLTLEGHGQTYAPTAGQLTLANLDIAIDMFRNVGRPDCIVLPRQLRRYISTIARDPVANNFALIDIGSDAFGRQVTQYDGIPLRITEDGRNASNVTVPVQAFDEAASTCSIYMIKFGKDEVCGLMGAEGSMEVKRFGEIQAMPQYMGRLEWYPGVAIFDKYSLVRYSNILAPA